MGGLWHCFDRIIKFRFWKICSVGLREGASLLRCLPTSSKIEVDGLHHENYTNWHQILPIQARSSHYIPIPKPTMYPDREWKTHRSKDPYINRPIRGVPPLLFVLHPCLLMLKPPILEAWTTLSELYIPLHLLLFPLISLLYPFTSYFYCIIYPLRKPHDFTVPFFNHKLSHP